MNWEWVTTTAMEYWARLLELIAWGYARSPELMVGLGIIAILPWLALFGMILRRPRPKRSAPATDRDYVADWRRQARIEIEDSTLPPSGIATGLTRIGRQDDNEICIPDNSVHRYHAAIERSPEGDVVICDLSGPEGNGVRINGERVAAAPLADGDLVELGRVKLRFVCTTIEERFDDVTGVETPTVH